MNITHVLMAVAIAMALRYVWIVCSAFRTAYRTVKADKKELERVRWGYKVNTDDDRIDGNAD